MPEWKRAKLVDALSRAGFPEAPVGPLERTPPDTRRRADLALRRGPGGVALVGFHGRGSDTVTDLATCLVLDPRIVALFEPLRALFKRLAALKREGSAVVNLLETGPDLLLRTDGVLDAPARGLLAAFASEHGIPRIAWAQGNALPETAAQLGRVSIAFGGVPVAPPTGAFLQASPAGEAAIVAAVLAGLPAKLPPRASVADLRRARHVELPAGDPRPGNGLRRRGELGRGAVGRGGQSGRAGAGGAARPGPPAFDEEYQGYAAVVLDPPYTGAAAQVGLLAKANVPKVIYVSCNPAALAQRREALRQRRPGYRVASRDRRWTSSSGRRTSKAWSLRARLDVAE